MKGDVTLIRGKRVRDQRDGCITSLARLRECAKKVERKEKKGGKKWV